MQPALSSAASCPPRFDTRSSNVLSKTKHQLCSHQKHHEHECAFEDRVKRVSGYLGLAMGQQDVWFCAICKGWLEMSEIEISVSMQGWLLPCVKRVAGGIDAKCFGVAARSLREFNVPERSAHDVRNWSCPEKTRASPKQMLLRQSSKNAAINSDRVQSSGLPGVARRGVEVDVDALGHHGRWSELWQIV